MKNIRNKGSGRDGPDRITGAPVDPGNILEKVMQGKGLSIFQKLLFALISVVLISLVISGGVHYQAKAKFIRQTIETHLSDSLRASGDYFQKIFAVPIETDLSFIESSPLLDNYLISRKDEALLTKPLVERLFLFFTNPADGIYLSARFIDSKGVEKVITEGRRRVKAYAASDHFPDETHYRRIYSLFRKLKTENVKTILFEGPFKDEKNRLTFIVGISKMDPEIGGFGGAVIFHCDLSGYLNYLADLKFNQAGIAYVFGPDNRLLLLPKKGASPKPASYSYKDDIHNGLAVSSSITLGSKKDVLVKYVLVVPRELLTVELQKTLIRSALIGISIIILIAIAAFYLSMKHFINPIKGLIEGARRIGRGDLNYRIGVSARDEIAQLAGELNRMADGLKKTTVSRDILIQEVAERKKAEESLRESEAKYRTLFDNAPVMDIRTYNQDGVPIITACNKLFADTLGYAREELLQKPLKNFYSNESGRELMEGGGYQRTLAGGIFAEERQLLTRAGSVVETLMRTIPEKNSNGVVYGSRAMFVDITQRKNAEKALRESEERFRALFEQAYIGVAEIDTETGQFVRINQKYCDIAGYSHAEMLSATFMQITHPEDLQPDLDNVRKIRDGEIHVYYREKRYVRKDGTIVWVHLTVSPVLQKGEQSGRHIAVVEEITERKLAEEQRSRLILKLQRALDEVKTLSGLLPICSHCKKVRDDKGYWSQIESYIHQHSGAEFSHGICPECAKRYYPEFNLYDDSYH